MQLGSLIARLDADADPAATIAALGDIVLFCRVESMGRSFDENAAEYVANAVRRFAAQAGDEAWLRLTRALEGSADPTAAALRSMLEWALERDASETEGTSEPGCCHRH